MDLEKSVPLAEGAIDVEQAGASGRNKNCLNCGTPLTDSFCSHCGQKDLPARQTSGELLVNFVSSFWSFESKFFRTGKYLLFKPGFLAIEYNAGKREGYYHPARLYVFISFVYFLLFTTLPDTEVNKTAEQQSAEVEYNDYGTAFSIGKEYKSKEEYDSLQNLLSVEKRDGKFMRRIQYRAIELNQKYQGKSDQFKKDFTASFTNNFSKIFFVLLPIFALLLKLLYVRRDFYYSEHLVFSIYYYNFFYLAGSFYMLLDQISWLQWLAIVVGFWIAIYLLLGMKKMYKQRWGKTIVKYVIFVLTFGFCISIGLFINLIITLMYI